MHLIFSTKEKLRKFWTNADNKLINCHNIFMSGKPKTEPQKDQKKTQAEEREARLKEQLRKNLQRRKAQKRGRADGA